MSGNTVCVCTLSLVKYLSSVSLFDIFVGEKVLPCLFNTQCCKLSKGHTGFHVVHISSTCLCIYKQAFIFWHLFMKVWTERAVIKYFVRPTQDFFFFWGLHEHGSICSVLAGTEAPGGVAASPQPTPHTSSLQKQSENGREGDNMVALQSQGRGEWLSAQQLFPARLHTDCPCVTMSVLTVLYSVTCLIVKYMK